MHERGPLSVPDVLVQRRAASDVARESMRVALAALEVDHERHPPLTIYATGSLGRRELGTHSDLDVFLVDTADAGAQVGTSPASGCCRT